jgi:hypothetical protein
MKLNDIRIIPHYDENYNIDSITILPPKGFKIKGDTSVIIFEKEN